MSADAPTGWVFRSDAAASAPPPVASSAIERRPAPPPRAERPAAEPSRPRERGWLESGLYVMALPMAITMGMMLAPAIWMFRARSRS